MQIVANRPGRLSIGSLLLSIVISTTSQLSLRAQTNLLVALKPASKQGLPADAGVELKVLAEIDKLTAAGSFQQARQLVTDLTTKYPEDPRVHIAAANLYRNMGLSTEAVAQYNQAYRLNQGLVEPLIALSQLYLVSLNLDLGISYARLAVNKQPSSLPAHLALAKALIASDRLSEADKEIQQLIRQSPSDANTLYLAFQLYRKRGDLYTASSYLSQAVRGGPPKAQWLYEQSEVLETMGDYDGALRALTNLLALQPGSVKAEEKLAGVLEFSLHDYSQAIEHYQKALEGDPDSVTAAAGIDRCQAKKNDLAFQLKVLIHQVLLGFFQQLFRTGDARPAGH
jgi:tetratricopeptide (TPR) repeat protein